MSLFSYLKWRICALFVRAMFRLKLGVALPNPTETIHIPSRTPEKRHIKINVYRSSAAEKRPSPVLINFHGSGFIIPMHGSDDVFCRRVAEQTPYTVLDVAYRLAPENPWPAAHHDAEDVVNWVLQIPKEFDLTQIAISGFSAGAQMACVASAVTFPKGTFNALLAFYPTTNLHEPAADKNAPDPSGNPLPGWLTTIFLGCYMPGDYDLRDPSISPLFAPPENYPQDVLVVTAACDTLCLEGESLYSRIKEDKNHNIIHYRAEKCDHAWDKNVQRGSVQEAARDHAYSLAVDLLRIT